MDANQSLSLTVVDNIVDPILITASSQEEQSEPSSSRVVPSEGREVSQATQWKRRRPCIR